MHVQVQYMHIIKLGLVSKSVTVHCIYMYMYMYTCMCYCRNCAIPY